MSDEWGRPGPKTSDNPIGKRPSGAQDQGSNITVDNYCDVDTGKGKAPISGEMVNPLGNVPTGGRTGGL